MDNNQVRKKYCSMIYKTCTQKHMRCKSLTDLVVSLSYKLTHIHYSQGPFLQVFDL